MDCPRPIKSVLPRFYPTWSSRTRPSMRIQRSEGLGSRLAYDTHDPNEKGQVDLQHLVHNYKIGTGLTRGAQQTCIMVMMLKVK